MSDKFKRGDTVEIKTSLKHKYPDWGDLIGVVDHVQLCDCGCGGVVRVDWGEYTTAEPGKHLEHTTDYSAKLVDLKA